MIDIRPVEPRDKDAVVILLGGDARTVDSPSNHVHVAEESGIVIGAVVWIAATGDVAFLGRVITTDPNNWKAFYGLIKATAEDALARGYTKAQFTLKDQRLLDKVQRDFQVEPKPAGWEPNSGMVVEWTIEVDLRDALEQLEPVI